MSSSNIMAMRISNIGYLLGSSKAVNRTILREALERDIYKEMSVCVKLDLQINRIWLTDETGKRVYTEAIGVQCASESLQAVVV